MKQSRVTAMDEDARYRWRRDGVEKLANSGRLQNNL